MGAYPRVETPDIADEAVVVDAGDVLQGAGAGGLRWVHRVRRHLSYGCRAISDVDGEIACSLIL
jgi:hypothetical protein